MKHSVVGLKSKCQLKMWDNISILTFLFNFLLHHYGYKKNLLTIVDKCVFLSPRLLVLGSPLWTRISTL